MGENVPPTSKCVVTQPISLQPERGVTGLSEKLLCKRLSSHVQINNHI